MKYKILGNKYILFAAMTLFIFGCSKMDATYKEFLEGGEIRYPKRLDSIEIFPGKNRLKLGVKESGQEIAKCLVVWNSNLDSLTIPLSGLGEMATAMINNISEGTHKLSFFTFDKKGNKSLGMDTTIFVYGDKYENNLGNRVILSAMYRGGEARVEWGDVADSSVVRVELNYTDPGGVEHSLPVFNGTMLSKLNLLKGDTFSYRTLHLPTPNAIDTFYSSSEKVIITRYPPPGGIYDGFPETFEDKGKKTKYPQADVEIGSGLWNFDYFQIGTAGADRKNGARSARSYAGQSKTAPVTSFLEMKFDLPFGASRISFYHAICSSDDPSTFKVQASTDGGTTWDDISGVLHNDDIELKKTTLELDITDPVRFRFYKFSNTEAGRDEGRMNIDDISIYAGE